MYTRTEYWAWHNPCIVIVVVALDIRYMLNSVKDLHECFKPVLTLTEIDQRGQCFRWAELIPNTRPFNNGINWTIRVAVIKVQQLNLWVENWQIHRKSFWIASTEVLACRRVMLPKIVVSSNWPHYSWMGHFYCIVVIRLRVGLYIEVLSKSSGHPTTALNRGQRMINADLLSILLEEAQKSSTCCCQ